MGIVRMPRNVVWLEKRSGRVFLDCYCCFSGVHPQVPGSLHGQLDRLQFAEETRHPVAYHVRTVSPVLDFLELEEVYFCSSFRHVVGTRGMQERGLRRPHQSSSNLPHGSP